MVRRHKYVWIAAVMLVVMVLLEWVNQPYPYVRFEIKGLLYMFTGLVSCVVILIMAKLSMYLLKRHEHYYDKR